MCERVHLCIIHCDHINSQVKLELQHVVNNVLPVLIKRAVMPDYGNVARAENVWSELGAVLKYEHSVTPREELARRRSVTFNELFNHVCGRGVIVFD